MKFNKICDTISYVQEYECAKIVEGYSFCADKCLHDEIIWLNKIGIKTYGCCCGRHVNCEEDAFINIGEEHLCRAIGLGYKYCVNKFRAICLSPKTCIDI